MKYTHSQLQATKVLDKHLQIIACAGSGKTEVISVRTIELLKNGASPSNIAAFTFTEKAAAELKDRIANKYQKEFGSLVGLAEMFVGTIHGYCLNLLQENLYSEYLKYSVLNDVKNQILITRNSRKSGLTATPIITGPSAGQLLSLRDAKLFLEVMNLLREDKVNESLLHSQILESLDSYEKLLIDKKYLDFSMILAKAADALTDRSHPQKIALQEKLSKQLKYLIVDEYQDVNYIQELLIRRIAELGANICVVGDDDQMIYGWRGSKIENILTFSSRYKPVVQVTLAENFRSSPGIVVPSRSVASENYIRLQKKMLPGGHQKHEQGDVLALEFDNSAKEAKWIVEKVASLMGVAFFDRDEEPARGISYSDCAILLRSVRSSAEPITKALKEKGIPFTVKGMANLFQTEEVKAAVGIFEYVNNRISESQLKNLWQDADLGLSSIDLDAGIILLKTLRTWPESARWASYTLQRSYLEFLEAIQLREEKVPVSISGASRGEVVFYNLGRFSQAIMDFEDINFLSNPKDKFERFMKWLEFDAHSLYEEGGDSAGYAQPNAVQIMTVHQSKGQEWPVVFVPALEQGRFPTRKKGGRGKWHLLPREAVNNADAYDGGIEDERRLFYVAITRSKKFLFCTFAPSAAKGYGKRSVFFEHFSSLDSVERQDVKVTLKKITPRQKVEIPNVALSFSELKYFSECPYQFKLRFLYGFNPPADVAMGFGRSIHNALAEIHKRAINGTIVKAEEAREIVEMHFHAPFANKSVTEKLQNAATELIAKYVKRNGSILKNVIHTELPIEVHIEPSITVMGRIDLVRREDTNEVAIVDFKSDHRAQSESVNMLQLHTYALGYRQLTGADADKIGVINLDKDRDELGAIDPQAVSQTENNIRAAASALRANDFQALPAWCNTCSSCDFSGICRKPR